MSEPVCAVWYWRFGGLYVDVWDDEEDAVYDAIAMEDNGTGSVAGVQFADGRFVGYSDWPALRAEEERRRREWKAQEAERAAKPKPATREVEPPFDAQGSTATVRADAPSWLGRNQ